MSAEREAEFPPAQGDLMGTPAPEEKVLWRGRPDLWVLARTAFHTRSAAVYLGALALISVVIGNYGAAAFVVAFGLVALAILFSMAWLTRKNTLYIITDVRVIMRIGMAVDKRINLPLKLVGAAHLVDRGKGFGDIALEPVGSHVLSYLLLWPHVRPWNFAKPQPMLRAIPKVEIVAAKLALATSQFEAIERGEAGNIDPDQSSGAPELAGATA